MIGPSQILDIAKRGLLAHQYALAVTSHNIANINTPGYSRQRPIFMPTYPIRLAEGIVGTGVKIEKVERMRDQLIDFQVRDQLSQVGEWDSKDKTLKQIEALINEPSELGLSQMIVEFFNAWMDVANAPEETAGRRVVVEKAEILSNTFHRLKKQLQIMVDNLNEKVQYTVDQINAKAENIAELNVQITQFESTGKNANDLRDTRDKLVDELSKLADIQTVEYEDGSLTVCLNYNLIVDRGNTVKLTTEMVEREGLKMLDIFHDGNRLLPGSGELKGFLEIRDKEIPLNISKLDDLAKGIIDNVNALHQVGYGLDGTTGKDFFKGSSADTIKVNPEILADLALIAASTDGSPGDGSNALAIAELADALTMVGGTATFSDYYRSVVSEIGANSEFAGLMLDNEQTLLTQFENYRDSVMGVSLDEEMINMINYQHAFEAASRLVSVADSLFETLIGMV